MNSVFMKRVLALVLSVVMAVGLMTGCGDRKEESKETKESESTVVNAKETENASEETEVEELEPVTIKWVYNNAESEKTQDVLEVFNEKLQELLPNTTVEFQFVSDYKTNWPLLIASGESMDIAWAGYNTPFQQDVEDGNLLGLSELMEAYAPNLMAEKETWEKAYASATMDEELWGIPCIQPVVAESQQFLFFPSVEPYLDFEALEAEFRASKKLTEKMLDILEAGIQAGIDDGAFKVGDPSWWIGTAFSRYASLLGYMSLGTEGYNMVFDPEAENPEVMYCWEVPEYKMAVERYAKWYDMGWVTETQILGQSPDDVIDTFGFSNAWNGSWAGCDENGIKLLSATNGSKTMMTNLPTEGYVGPSVFGSESSYLAIPYTSENPERAMMLLNILHDEPGTPGNDLMNLLCYGFEKNSEEAKEYGWYNYSAEEIDGQLQVVIPEGQQSKHTMTNWALGNTFKIMHDGGSLTTTAAKEYALSFYTDIYPQLKRTAVAGMIVDYSGLQAETDAIATVHSEYYPQLSSGCGGVDNVEATFESAFKKLEEAGLSKVKAELQAQVDAYIANN